jgi:hypothetical protein
MYWWAWFSSTQKEIRELTAKVGALEIKIEILETKMNDLVMKEWMRGQCKGLRKSSSVHRW